MNRFFSSVVAATAASVVSMSLCLSSPVMAAPWVDASDIYLRADIQALADAGVITVPINTYPLMWAGIGAELSRVEPETLTPAQVQAFARVNFYYNNAVANRGNSSIKAVAASDVARFRHFGSDSREKGEFKAAHEYLGANIAFKVSASASHDPSDNKEFRFDDSYLAVILGNWVISAGAMEQWWGPGFDSALHRSSNARPLPSLLLSRNNASGFESPWLSWIGPWTLTTGLSLLEKERAVPHAALWNFRAGLRPIRQVELGVSWSTQFCAEGLDCDDKSFVKNVSGGIECAEGSATCEPSIEANRMAGFDMRYGDTWFSMPVGLYIEHTCEESSGSTPWKLADCAYLVGTDTRINFEEQQYKLFLEYTETLVTCGENVNAFDCFYEHSTYNSGSRYYGRALGSTYDSDAKVYALGLVGQLDASRGFTSIFRYAQLNYDGSNVTNVWAPQPPKEDILMLELSYRQPLWQGMATLGGTLSKSEFVADNTESQASIFGSYEYRF
jgi:hypothetical protein